MIFKKLKIKPKIIIAFSIVVFFVVFIAAVGAVQIGAINRSNRAVYEENIIPLEGLEKFKSEFSELRRLVIMTDFNGVVGNDKITQKGIEASQKQHEQLRETIKNNILQLTEAGAEESRIEAAKELLRLLEESYWPIAEEVNEAALSGNKEVLQTRTEALVGTAEEIQEILNSLFTSRITMAAEKSVAVSAVLHQSMIVLLIVGIISVIISIIFAVYIGNSISKPIIELRKATGEITRGNLNLSLNSNSNDELGDLTRDLAVVIDTLGNVTGAIDERMKKYEKNGDIKSTIDTSQFQGVFKSIAESLNYFIQATVDDVLIFMECIEEFSDGNFNADVPKLPGAKAVMNEAVDNVRSRLKSISGDINILVNAAAEGQLSMRVEAGKYKGDWAAITNNLNRLMEAISGPVFETEKVLKQISVGNFSDTVNGNYYGEFLQMKISINDMINNMASYIDEISEILGALSNNDLDQSVEREYVGKFSLIKDALNSIINKFNHVILDISSSAEQVAAGAKHISESSVALAQGAAEQASSVEELNATVQIINQNTSENADNAKSAEKLSEFSRNNALKGDAEMQNMLAAMEAIKESSNSISKIIKVIDDIAFQTNLLALNAAVEAARAGVHGKGFAVVAEEVRNLASRSQNAAKETAELIEESINRVGEGTQMAGATADALQTILADVDKVAGIIGGIANASGEQSAAVGQVTEGLSQIADVVQQNSATSEEAASASEELSSQVEVLRELVGVFNLKRTNKYNPKKNY